MSVAVCFHNCVSKETISFILRVDCRCGVFA